MTAAEPSGRGKGRAFIPMPADFPTRGRDMTQAEASEHYGVAIRVIIRWRKEAGFSGRALPMPADFPKIGPKLNKSDACKRWGVHERVITRWHKQAGTQPMRYWRLGTKLRGAPAPKDFRAKARAMGVIALSRHYDISPKTIKRWCDENGIVAWRPTAMGRQPRIYCPKARKLNVRGVMCLPAIHRPVARDATREGQAADHLRRLCAVYRCTETGAADAKGKFWRVGFAVLSGAELIARAERKGWNPRAWMEIAA